MKTVMPLAHLRWVAKLANELTGGAFSFMGVGGDQGHGARYIDGVRQLVWLGRTPGARTEATAYYFGAVMRWVRMSMITLTDEDAARLAEIQRVAWSTRGDWAKWALEGEVDAEYRWNDRNTLLVSEPGQGTDAPNGVIDFKVVRNRGRAYDGQELVEFYDTRFPFSDYGQFVTRYQIGQLVGHDQGVGLNLYGGVSNWSVSGRNMDRIRAWLVGR